MDAADSSFNGVIESMPGPGLKEKYRLLISAMTPAERALRTLEVAQFAVEKPHQRIANERFLRKTAPKVLGEAQHDSPQSDRG